MRSSMSTLLTIPALLAQSVIALDNDFSAYPSGSQACLTDAADQSQCTGDTGEELNQCLCTNQGNFIYNTASCVAKDSPSDLKTVYATLKANCAGTGVTIAVSEDAFLAQAAAATSSTSTAGPTSTTSTSETTGTQTGTQTSTPTPTSSAAAAGLSTGAKVGIGAGVGLGSIALVLAGVFLWIYNRRRRTATYTQTNSPPGEYSSTFGQPSPHPHSAIPLSDTSSAWKSPASGVGGYYKPDDMNRAAGQPLLAELGSSGMGFQHAPVELPVDYHPQPQYGQDGYHADLPGDSDHGRFSSPPQRDSPYSPPYQRSNF
ncbi:hypothetical protein BJ170DRAFT_119539 [Xylariales sp. AK1849]|nr:hypothetical protein BJ170DRAFT_119539 [Xylariales sp. AK1849]